MSRRLQAPTVLESGTLNQSLLLLSQIGEAANLGVLKGFAGVVYLLLDTCQTATANKGESAALAQDVGALAMAVAGQVEEHKEEIAADTELLDQISKLCLELEACHDVLKELFKRGSFSWFVKHSQDEVKIQRLQRSIKHSIDLFSLQSSIRIQRGLKRSETLDAARKVRILDEIKEVCQAVMSEIKAGNPMPANTAKSAAPTPVLPRVPRHFYGREKQIDAAVTVLTASAPGKVAILGAAGIGKTSIASKVLYDQRIVDCFGDRRYFIACDAAGGKDELLTAIAGPLGLQGDKLQKKILDMLGDSAHRSILVLDNFESPWEATDASKKEVESFLASLSALGNLALVLTMRGSERPAGVQWSRPFLPPLSPLDVQSARQAFLALSDCVEDDPWIDPLLSAIDYVPLAIALMANLAETDSTETLLARWREEHSSLLHRTPDRRSSLDISIGISLNSPRMKAVPEALELLSLISLLPDGVENTQLGDIFPNIKFRRALSALWQTALAYNDGNNRTRVLSPIRAHMLLYHQSDTAHRMSVLTYYMGLAGLSSDLGGPHGQDIVKRLAPEIGNLHSIVNLTLESTEESPKTTNDMMRAAIRAAIDLSKFIRYTRLGNPETLRAARIAANVLGDQGLRADVLYHLAWINIGDQNWEHERLCREALRLYEESGNISGQAESTWLLGQIYKATKRQKECKALYEKALALSIESQNKTESYSARYCQAKCLSCLSEMVFYQGDVDTSETLSQQALTLFREVENLTNIGLTLYWLGRIAIFRGNPSDAYVKYEEAAEIFKQAGAPFQLGRILISKGDSAMDRCDFASAQRDYNEAITVFRESGFAQSGIAAYAHMSLGTVASLLYNYPEANRHLGDASRVFEQRNLAHGKLHCDIVYGDMALYEDRHGEAETFYRQALIAAVSLGFAEEEAACRMKLGMLEIRRGWPRVGLGHLLVAAAIQRQSKDVKGLGKTLVQLGECFIADGDKRTSLLFFRTARPICRSNEGLRDVAGCLAGIGRICGSREQVEEAQRLYLETGDRVGGERCRRILAEM
ncbi:hypothetical protein C8J57DRAFT_643858 [Mycena rebaudengoi]|nr:hypothetical protein C8J57DRAFT_643858 [Mycena rebaudengoi]